MATLHKITSGFIIQKFDENGVFIGQEFVFNNVEDTSYENEVGDKVDIPHNDTNVRFELKQPYNFTDVELTNDCFNKLIAQGGCSTYNGGGCRYRGTSGRKCAIGLYLPDEDYYDELENGAACETSMNPIHMKLCSILRSVGIKPSRMNILQRCHDNSPKNKNQIESLERYRQTVLLLLDKGFTLESLSEQVVEAKYSELYA